jgi:histidinol-phosphatase (PHP family)
VSDYHLHLHPHPHRPSPDAPPPGEYPDGYIERFVEEAASRGVDELGFTEHLYRCVESADALGRWWDDERDPSLVAGMEEVLATERNLSLDRYVEVVLDAKARGLPVKLGLEVDFVPGTETAVLDLIGRYPFDFLVGSIHWIGAWNFMRATARDEFVRRGVRQAWDDYFALASALARSGMVDVLGHVDVIKVANLVPDGSLDDLYEPVVAGAARSGTAVEVSSAGLRREVAEVHPAPRFLELFREAGVPITLASDGHVPAEAGLGHDDVVRAARAAGYTEHLRYDARQRVVVPLPDLTAPAPTAGADVGPGGPATPARE